MCRAQETKDQSVPTTTTRSISESNYGGNIGLRWQDLSAARHRAPTHHHVRGAAQAALPSAKAANRCITGADRNPVRVIGEVTAVATTFAELTVTLLFLLLAGAPLELIVGVAGMESVGREIHLRRKVVNFNPRDGSVPVSLPILKEQVEELGEEIAKFATDKAGEE